MEEEGGSKKCHTCPTMMKLGTVTPYLMKMKNIYESPDASPWVLLRSTFFHRKSENFAVSRNTDVGCILVQNL